MTYSYWMTYRVRGTQMPRDLFILNDLLSSCHAYVTWRIEFVSHKCDMTHSYWMTYRLGVIHMWHVFSSSCHEYVTWLIRTEWLIELVSRICRMTYWVRVTHISHDLFLLNHSRTCHMTCRVRVMHTWHDSFKLNDLSSSCHAAPIRYDYTENPTNRLPLLFSCVKWGVKYITKTRAGWFLGGSTLRYACFHTGRIYMVQP